jgi:N6-adenosine-specific RNA methylase IME4
MDTKRYTILYADPPWTYRDKAVAGEKLFWGMGNWTRSNTEVCLLGVRGKPRRLSAGVHSVVQAPLRAHSQKPDEVRERIVALLGDVPRLELFARDRAPGWDAWGNEVEVDPGLPLPCPPPVRATRPAPRQVGPGSR